MRICRTTTAGLLYPELSYLKASQSASDCSIYLVRHPRPVQLSRFMKILPQPGAQQNPKYSVQPRSMQNVLGKQSKHSASLRWKKKTFAKSAQVSLWLVYLPLGHYKTQSSTLRSHPQMAPFLFHVISTSPGLTVNLYIGKSARCYHPTKRPKSSSHPCRLYTARTIPFCWPGNLTAVSASDPLEI